MLARSANSLFARWSTLKSFAIIWGVATALALPIGYFCYRSVIGIPPEGFFGVIILMMICIAGPLIGQSVLTIKSLQYSQNHLTRMRDELDEQVTELDTVSNRLTEAHAQLESRVRQRTLELEEAKHSAEAANRAKTQFLSNISHELRTPLNAVLGFSDLLVRHHAEGQTQTDRLGEDYAQTIHESGTHLLSLVNDLIDLAKIEAGRIDVEMEPLNLRTMLLGVTRIMEPQLKGKGLRIAVTQDNPELMVFADRRAQKQVLFSVLTRAISLASADSLISIEVEELENGPTIYVRHPGPTMTAEEIERALEPFAQLSAPQISRGESMTLALAISRSLMELQGGALNIISDLTGGVTVALSFARVVSAEDAKTG